MKKATIGKLLMDKNNNTPVLELNVEGTDKKVYLWIGACEAWALAMSIENFHLIRPMTHDLLISAVEIMGGIFEHVVIHSIKNGTFLANLVIKKVGKERQNERVDQYVELDARPSDCLVIANKLDVPVYITSEVLLEAGMSDSISTNRTDPEEREKEEFRSFLNDFNMNELKQNLNKREDEGKDEKDL
ncbi:MAG: bifunctional nuclease family protein [Thermotogota bacterium]